MAHIPDEFVIWGVEDVVERDSELHHAEAGAQVAPGFRHGVHDLLPQLCSQLFQILTKTIEEID